MVNFTNICSSLTSYGQRVFNPHMINRCSSVFNNRKSWAVVAVAVAVVAICLLRKHSLQKSKNLELVREKLEKQAKENAELKADSVLVAEAFINCLIDGFWAEVLEREHKKNLSSGLETSLENRLSNGAESSALPNILEENKMENCLQVEVLNQKTKITYQELLQLIQNKKVIPWECVENVFELFQGDFSKELLKEMNRLLEIDDDSYPYLRKELSRLSIEQVFEAQKNIEKHNDNYWKQRNETTWSTPTVKLDDLTSLNICLSNIVIDQLEEKMNKACECKDQGLVEECFKQLQGVYRPNQRNPGDDEFSSVYKPSESMRESTYSVMFDFLPRKCNYDEKVYVWILDCAKISSKEIFGYRCILWANVIKYENIRLLNILKDKKISINFDEKNCLANNNGYVHILFSVFEDKLTRQEKEPLFQDLFANFFQSAKLHENFFSTSEPHRSKYPKVKKLLLSCALKEAAKKL